MTQDPAHYPPTTSAGGRFGWAVLAGAFVAFLALIALGTWQVQRLAWKEGLIATIGQRVASPPEPLAKIEALYAATGDVDYWPVTVRGTFLPGKERHFLATWEGQSGFHVYAPLMLDDERIVFVNRGFVPYDRKEASTRPASSLTGTVEIKGLARNPLAQKPSFIVPENDPAKNVFYWKDIGAMAATVGLPAGAVVLPFFIDADATPNPGGLPIGGVTMINMPNNHLQYALTWYGLAAALAGIVGVYLWRRRQGSPETN